MKLLVFGDVCGEPGMKAVESKLRGLKQYYGAELCVVNGENTDVAGIRPEHATRLFAAGADAVTLGNHCFKRQQIARTLEDEARLLRPANLEGALPGLGHVVLPTSGGKRLCLCSLVGRFNLQWDAQSPFLFMDKLMKRVQAELFVVDFHAEATSEKAALAYHLDGRAAAVFGTHTHVQTSDARILPGGTGFITDVGMCGAANSVLGVKPEQSVSMFLGGLPGRFECPPGPAKMEGALFTLDADKNRCVSVEALRIEL